MTEQEQAAALARWLDQPAGTPPPEGLDPEVVEGVYAMRPDLAPAPSLTADDILADFDLVMGGGTVPPVAEPVDQGLPPTPVGEAPVRGRAANRVAGLAVLMAVAATLILVVLPEAEPPMVAGEAAMEEVAAAPPARQAAPDPIASVDDEPAPEAVEVAAGPTPAEPVIAEGEVGTVLGAGDAVADAATGEGALEFKQEQQYRYGNEAPPPIPEVEEALRDEWVETDAVAVVDEEPSDEDYAAPKSAPSTSAPSAAAPQAPAMDLDETDYYGGKGAAKKESRQQRRAEEPAAEEPAYQAPSSRSAAVPSDVGDQWRQAADAATEQAIDEALRRAAAERSLGNTSQAVSQLLPHIAPPALAGQHVATVAVRYQIEAGDLNGAISTAQRGLALTTGNSPYRSLLLALYGNALDAAGDPTGAEAAWREAASLNAAR